MQCRERESWSCFENRTDSALNTASRILSSGLFYSLAAPELGPFFVQLRTRVLVFSRPFSELERQIRWGQMAQRAVWTMMILIMPPRSKYLACFGQGWKVIHVQTLVAQSSVERRDKSFSAGLPGRMKSSFTPPR